MIFRLYFKVIDGISPQNFCLVFKSSNLEFTRVFFGVVFSYIIQYFLSFFISLSTAIFHKFFPYCYHKFYYHKFFLLFCPSSCCIIFTRIPGLQLKQVSNKQSRKQHQPTHSFPRGAQFPPSTQPKNAHRLVASCQWTFPFYVKFWENSK